MDKDRPARPVLPLVALLALASALGVAVAIALAGIAMLLAIPAHADEGSLLLERRGHLAGAQLLFGELESDEDGHTRVVEVYHNPFAEPLSGVYLYRLPGNAEVERLTFTSRGAPPRHAVFTLRRGAALVERTAQIGPGETLVVELEYRTRSARGVLARR